MPAANAKSKYIMSICNDPRLIGFPLAIATINEYETKIETKHLNNAESWLGPNDSHNKKLQNCKDDFIMKVFQYLQGKHQKAYYGWIARC